MNIKKHIGIWLTFVIGGTIVLALKILLFPAVQVPAQRSEPAAYPTDLADR